MKKKYWAQPCWWVLHMLAAHYPIHPSEEQKINFKKFLEHFAKVLPCDICSKHFSEYLQNHEKELEGALKNRKEMESFMFHFHEHVNKDTNHPSSLNLQQVRTAFGGDRWNDFDLGYPISFRLNSKEGDDIVSSIPPESSSSSRIDEKSSSNSILHTFSKSATNNSLVIGLIVGLVIEFILIVLLFVLLFKIKKK